MDNTQEEIYPGYINVNKEFWHFEHNAPYPFTANGEISCENHPLVGKAVFFNPEGYTNEFYVGTPLNESAQKLIDLIEISSNVPYKIKDGADLSEVIMLILEKCN